MSTIEVRYSRIHSAQAFEGGVPSPFYHKYMVYDDGQGHREFSRGGPGPTGNLETHSDIYDERSIDWDPTGTDP